MKRLNNQGFLSLELAVILGLVGMMMLGMMTQFGRVKQSAELMSAQKAMLYMQAEQPSMKFPATVTLTDLVVHGAMVDGYEISNYSLTGTPNGSEYNMELKTPKQEYVCVHAASVVYDLCL